MVTKILYRWPDGRPAQKEIKLSNGVTIDLMIGAKQGYAASNQVAIYGLKGYGGYILGTPKNFPTKLKAEAFVRLAIEKIKNKEFGKRVAFRRK